MSWHFVFHFQLSRNHSCRHRGESNGERLISFWKSHKQRGGLIFNCYCARYVRVSCRFCLKWWRFKVNASRKWNFANTFKSTHHLLVKPCRMSDCCEKKKKSPEQKFHSPRFGLFKCLLCSLVQTKGLRLISRLLLNLCKECSWHFFSKHHAQPSLLRRFVRWLFFVNFSAN